MKFLKDSMRHRKDLRERFLREAAAASSLKHPNLVEIEETAALMLPVVSAVGAGSFGSICSVA